MITKSYFKLVKVSYADSDYFRVTNIDTTTGTLTINGTSNLEKNLEYSTDGVNWTTADPNAPFSLAVPAGANVYMRGMNTSSNGFGYHPINMDVNHNASGNVLSLINKTDYSTMTSCQVASALANLFANDTKLINAGNMNFGQLSSVTNNYFATSMFSGCTSLATAPELPMTTLSTSCYRGMFEGCTSLATAPELPATTLANNCYQSMFNGCTHLNSVKCLAENISASNCTNNWMNGVSATGTFYKSANMSSWPRTASGIPSGWTVVDA